jgi:hypothetical protein
LHGRRSPEKLFKAIRSNWTVSSTSFAEPGASKALLAGELSERLDGTFIASMGRKRRSRIPLSQAIVVLKLSASCYTFTVMAPTPVTGNKMALSEGESRYGT